MCGLDVDLDDDLVEEVSHDAVQLLAPPPVECEGSAWGSRRGGVACVFCGLVVALWNVGVGVACLTLLGVVFGAVLIVPVLLLYAGFLCHSRVLASPARFCGYLDDNACSALILLGFVMMSPLLVVAAAVSCSLFRWLRLLQLFQPISSAQYVGRGFTWRRDFHAWV